MAEIDLTGSDNENVEPVSNHFSITREYQIKQRRNQQREDQEERNHELKLDSSHQRQQRKMAERAPKRSRGFFCTENFEGKTAAEAQKMIDESIESLKQLSYIYLLVGLHTGEKSKVRHIHIDVEFKSQIVFDTVKRAIPRANIQPRKGTVAQAKAYILKPGAMKLCEEGEAPRGQANYLGIIKDCQSHRPLADIIHDNPEEAVKHFTNLQKIHALYLHEEKVEYEDHVLFPWQKRLDEIINQKPHPRKIICIIDRTGNAGKSWFVRRAVALYGANMFNNSRTTDIVHGWNPVPRPGKQPMCFFDFQRSMQSCINWGAVENVKNGLAFDPKYESGLKAGPIPHVICMLNQPPDTEKMSKDRWWMWYLPNPHPKRNGSMEVLESDMAYGEFEEEAARDRLEADRRAHPTPVQHPSGHYLPTGQFMPHIDVGRCPPTTVEEFPQGIEARDELEFDYM